MADERKIVIELKLSGTAGGGGGSRKDDDGETSLTDILKDIQHPIKTVEKNIFGKNVLVYELYSQAKQTIKKTALYSASKYFNLTENYKAEQGLQNVTSVVEHIGSIGTSILGGAIIGVKAGHPVIGAAVGLVVGAVNTGIDAAKSWDAQHMQLTTMNIQSSFQMTKLGLINNGRGTLN